LIFVFGISLFSLDSFVRSKCAVAFHNQNSFCCLSGNILVINVTVAFKRVIYRFLSIIFCFQLLGRSNT
jgi:hypothetical protein